MYKIYEIVRLQWQDIMNIIALLRWTRLTAQEAFDGVADMLRNDIVMDILLAKHSQPG